MLKFHNEDAVSLKNVFSLAAANFSATTLYEYFVVVQKSE